MCEMPGSLWGALPDSAHLLCSKGDRKAEDVGWPPEFHDSLSVQEAIQVENGHWSGTERHGAALSRSSGGILGKDQPHRPDRLLLALPEEGERF